MTAPMIREASAADAEQISALVCDIVPTLGYGTEKQVARFLAECYSPKVIRDQIGAGTHRYLIAVDKNGAFLGTGYVTGDGWLVGLHVHTVGRRSGIGRQLVEARLGIAANLGIPELRSSVHAGNTGMLALAAQHGFRVTGEDPVRDVFPDALFLFLARGAS